MTNKRARTMTRTTLPMLTIAALLLVLALSGCGSKKYEARAINEETDKCAQCNMQVKDDAFAVQLTTTDGKTYTFDDIGCMNKWKNEHASDAIGGQFVRDFNDLTWIAYEDAYYVYDASFRSPMAYGIYSFKDKPAAQAYLDQQAKGKLMTADELASHTWMQNMEQMKGMKQMSAGHDEQSHTLFVADRSAIQVNR